MTERKQAEEILTAILQEIKPIGESQLSDVRITSDLGKRIMIDVAERLASLRVAEATKGMYPRSFVEWKDMYVQFYAYGNIYEVRSTDKHFVGLESLFEYWKKHKQ